MRAQISRRHCRTTVPSELERPSKASWARPLTSLSSIWSTTSLWVVILARHPRQTSEALVGAATSADSLPSAANLAAKAKPRAAASESTMAARQQRIKNSAVRGSAQRSQRLSILVSRSARASSESSPISSMALSDSTSFPRTCLFKMSRRVRIKNDSSTAPVCPASSVSSSSILPMRQRSQQNICTREIRDAAWTMKANCEP
mmetsp:Transcript_84789/g.186153  ORF Transcript_84789/g.186153 Transcript_84789/m.186153 type:complete len:203 (-) Transcript_84789:7-615(-)